MAAGGGGPDPDRAGLSARETEVLSAIGQRLTNREIADRMFISIRTVESHVSALLRKLAVTDRAGLVAAAGELARQGQPRPLPEPATRFVARDVELAELAAMLDESRLVTVVGPAGVGKTRLAVRLAAALAPRYAEGARLADFAGLPPGSAVAGTVARTLNLVDQPSRSTAETLRDTALHLDCLLVADNCEHVLEELAPLLDAVLMAAGSGSSDTGSGGLRMLATSRQPIAVPGEVVYELAPLATADATALFVDRAAAAGGYRAAGQDPAAVAELCQALDGLPLAIELAAARTRTFGADQLLEQLPRRFELLIGGARTARPAHRSLRDALQLSFSALGDDEQTLLGRLTVFRGPFDFPAVDAVCGFAPLAPAAVTDLLPRLRDRSLVTGVGTDRYRLLESVRDYAAAELPADAAGGLRRRHREHYLAVAEDAAAGLVGPEQRERRAALQAEAPNFWAAMQSAVDDADAATGWRLVAALATYWADTGQRREAADWIERLQRAADPPVLAATAWGLAAAAFLLLAVDVERAERLAGEAARLAGQLGEDDQGPARLALGWALAYRGRRDAATAELHAALASAATSRDEALALQGLALATADLDTAVGYAERAAAGFRRIGDLTRLANALYTMADGALNADARLADAQGWLEESLRVADAAGAQHDRAHAVFGLARVGWQEDELDTAARLLAECVPVLRRIGDHRCAGRGMQMLGEMALRRGDPDEADRMLRASLAAAEPAGDGVTAARARRLLGQIGASTP